jgi:hypothetical protein
MAQSKRKGHRGAKLGSEQNGFAQPEGVAETSENIDAAFQGEGFWVVS